MAHLMQCFGSYWLLRGCLNIFSSAGGSGTDPQPLFLAKSISKNVANFWSPENFGFYFCLNFLGGLHLPPTMGSVSRPPVGSHVPLFLRQLTPPSKQFLKPNRATFFDPFLFYFIMVGENVIILEGNLKELQRFWGHVFRFFFPTYYQKNMQNESFWDAG